MSLTSINTEEITMCVPFRIFIRAKTKKDRVYEVNDASTLNILFLSFLFCFFFIDGALEFFFTKFSP